MLHSWKIVARQVGKSMKFLWVGCQGTTFTPGRLQLTGFDPNSDFGTEVFQFLLGQFECIPTHAYVFLVYPVDICIFIFPLL